MLTCWLSSAVQLGLNRQTDNTGPEMQKFYWPSRGQTSYQTSLGHTENSWLSFKEKEFVSGYPSLCFPVNTSSSSVNDVTKSNVVSGTQRFTSKNVNSMQFVKSSDAGSMSSMQSVASTGGVSVSIKSDQNLTVKKMPVRHTVVLVGGESNHVKRCRPRQVNKTWSQNTYRQAQQECGLPHVIKMGERRSVWSIDYSKHDYENISDIASAHSKLENRFAEFSIPYSDKDGKEREPENQTRKTPRSQKRPKGPRTLLRSKSCERMSSVILDNLSCMARSGRSSPVDRDPYLQEHEKVKKIST